MLQPEAQQGQRFRPRLKADLQMEISQLLFDLSQTGSRRSLLFPAGHQKVLASSRFTASRTTAEMARFTTTHFRASASLLVCQSW